MLLYFLLPPLLKYIFKVKFILNCFIFLYLGLNIVETDARKQYLLLENYFLIKMS